MAYLKVKRRKGRLYYQIIEARWEGGQKRERVLLHLGRDIGSPQALLKWWDYLGQPRIPFKPGVPAPFSRAKPSLEFACETITDLRKFLEQATVEDLSRVVEGLKFVMRKSPGPPGSTAQVETVTP